MCEETPARYIDLMSWPKRNSIRLSISYSEWFDWAEVFAAGIDDKLLNIADEFNAHEIYISGILRESSKEFSRVVKVIRIARDKLREAYFDAVWNDESMAQSGALAAAARMVLIWDKSQNWIVLNDRYYDIGLFAVFFDFSTTRNIFRCLDKQALMDRFSKIIAINKVASLSEVDKWSK
jgi:hypothetical protein